MLLNHKDKEVRHKAMMVSGITTVLKCQLFSPVDIGISDFFFHSSSTWVVFFFIQFYHHFMYFFFDIQL